MNITTFTRIKLKSLPQTTIARIKLQTRGPYELGFDQPDLIFSLAFRTSHGPTND